MNKKYTIKYRIILEGSNTIEDKEIKIANCMSSIHAQIRLEEYLRKKYINFKALEVKKCEESGIFDGFSSDIFSSFNDIFGGIKK
jgi:hypothetical protein